MGSKRDYYLGRAQGFNNIIIQELQSTIRILDIWTREGWELPVEEIYEDLKRILDHAREADYSFNVAWSEGFKEDLNIGGSTDSTI